MPATIKVNAPLAGTVITVAVEKGAQVHKGQVLIVLEAMKMHNQITAPQAGVIAQLPVNEGDLLQKGQRICEIMAVIAKTTNHVTATPSASTENPQFATFAQRINKTLDAERAQAVAKRHAKGYRSARENLADLCDPASFVEYGQLAIAAQRQRRKLADLQTNTAADGVLTGVGSVNGGLFSAESTQTALIINDYSVLAGTQGFFHHKKIDRLLAIAQKRHLPVIMYTEGGGGRPGDTDVTTLIAGLNVPTFATWAGLSGIVPRIAVNNGYCFAGNAALFGSADITIATQTSWIGMAGPAMIAGGGLGNFKPSEIGPIDVQAANGVVDVVAKDEQAATALAKQLLSYFQGDLTQWESADQSQLRHSLPAQRNMTYPIRDVIHRVVDNQTFLELRAGYGQGIVTGFARLAGKAVGVIANDCMVLGGAIDAVSAEKAADFLHLCNTFALPILSLADTPGFMVGPASEEAAAVRRMSRLFIVGASLTVPFVTIFLRKGYGLGAMAMAGGSFARPTYTAAWPTGEFGAMGLEGAVRLGFKKELAVVEGAEREKLFDQLLAQMVAQGQATEAAAYLEIDAVIDPAATRAIVIKAICR